MIEHGFNPHAEEVFARCVGILWEGRERPCVQLEDVFEKYRGIRPHPQLWSVTLRDLHDLGLVRWQRGGFRITAAGLAWLETSFEPDGEDGDS